MFRIIFQKENQFILYVDFLATMVSLFIGKKK